MYNSANKIILSGKEDVTEFKPLTSSLKLSYHFKLRSVTNFLPLFFLLCFSGNPIISSMGYSKILLVVYSFSFIVYVFTFVNFEYIKLKIQQILLVIVFIVLLVIYQRLLLGKVSYPGVIVLILKILLGLFTFIFYKAKRISFVVTYIKIMSFLAMISLPFFILNQFIQWGIQLDNVFLKSFFIYTSYPVETFSESLLVRNPGMFWEPGAFAGYLILALLFIVLENRSFTIGNYKMEILSIIAGIITSQSTAGYFLLGLLILLYAWNRYSWGKIVIVPLSLLLIYWGYNNIAFMGNKVEDQYSNAIAMGENDVSNTRFGALNMDLMYIKSQPLTGNGLDISIRYRFHPWVKEDIGHGNGMSNFAVIWGIPFFLYWLYCVYLFAYYYSQKKSIAYIFLITIVLILQGEQFLNFPMFLSFFSLPLFYKQFSGSRRNHFLKEDIKTDLNISL